ncbi:MAG: TolC family protein [Paracoccus sp. (in: a-proteobacteria)]|nr:TolC family protein [Paracoccus sp. (in: a-proteobacteria)]
MMFSFPRLSALLLTAGLVGGCAAVPELDGQPVTAVPARALMQPSATEPRLAAPDFGDAGLRRMLAEADLNGLDIAAARGRARAADLALQGAAGGRWPSVSASGSAARDGYSSGLSVSFDPDLSGRLSAQLNAAGLDARAAGLDLLIARRVLAREVTTGWVALSEAQTNRQRSHARLSLATREVELTRARLSGGEIAGTGLGEALNRRQVAQVAAATSDGQIALAAARLRALGVRTIPDAISLRSVTLPVVPSQTDLGRAQCTPEVRAAWLRFHSADASRAEALLAARPRLVATASLSSAGKTLAGLVSGNPLALAASLSVDGAVLDGGQSRNRLDQARLNVAQAEIAWLQARSRAEIAMLEASIELIAARAALDGALDGYRIADTERTRTRARHAAGVDDGSSAVSADSAVLETQMAVDAARARAFRAAAIWQDATGAQIAGCAAGTI